MKLPLGDAVDLPRHFFLFHALTDMALVATVVVAAHRIGLKSRYPATLRTHSP